MWDNAIEIGTCSQSNTLTSSLKSEALTLTTLLPNETTTGLSVGPHSILSLPPLSAWGIRGKPLLLVVAHNVSNAIPEFWSQACGPSDVLDVLCAAVTGAEVCLT